MKRVFLALALALAGCGYTTSSALGPNLRTVHIEKFKNNITYTTQTGRNFYFPLIEVNARKAVISRFLFDGNLRVTDADKADLILKGELKSYERDALRYDENDDVQEYRVRVVMSLELWDRRSNELVWSEPSFSGEEEYFLEGSQAITEEAAVNNAITDLSRRIVERTIENW